MLRPLLGLAIALGAASGVGAVPRFTDRAAEYARCDNHPSPIRNQPVGVSQRIREDIVVERNRI